MFCFVLFFNPDVKNLENSQLVEGVQEQVNAALLDYTVCNYPQQAEKFGQLPVKASFLSFLGVAFSPE